MASKEAASELREATSERREAASPSWARVRLSTRSGASRSPLTTASAPETPIGFDFPPVFCPANYRIQDPPFLLNGFTLLGGHRARTHNHPLCAEQLGFDLEPSLQLFSELLGRFRAPGADEVITVYHAD